METPSMMGVVTADHGITPLGPPPIVAPLSMSEHAPSVTENVQQSKNTGGAVKMVTSPPMMNHGLAAPPSMGIYIGNVPLKPCSDSVNPVDR
ncbi:UNVERIFIED_CONTAM: hypothetical protein Sradi_4540100 [Sesamum radiatum]|uniref:Uncharacterized protein n=1 Tax=Sesamum radiatum TaxID=300843 RepID=A0AAW2NAR8_SESRA